MDDKVVLERTVALGHRPIEEEHPHEPALPAVQWSDRQQINPAPVRYRLSRQTHSGGVLKNAAESQRSVFVTPAKMAGRVRVRLTVVHAGGVLHGDLDAVVPRASPPEVAALEVERGLGEPVQVREVVHSVDDVKRVHACRVDVRLECVRVHAWVLRVDEVEGRGRLRGRELPCAVERHNVVPTVCASESEKDKDSLARARRECEVEGERGVTYEVSVVLLLQSLCQPHGDAAKFWGFTRVSKP